eukprot:g19456.t1
MSKPFRPSVLRPSLQTRSAEAAVDTVEKDAAPKDGAEETPQEPGGTAAALCSPSLQEEPAVPLEGSVTIVQGASRTRVPWAPEESCRQLRARIEDSTGIPAAKQQLKLVNQEFLAEGDETQASYESAGKIKTIWLEDLRTPGDRPWAWARGEEEKTFIDELKQLWKLDNVTVVSLALVAYTFFKETNATASSNTSAATVLSEGLKVRSLPSVVTILHLSDTHSLHREAEASNPNYFQSKITNAKVLNHEMAEVMGLKIWGAGWHARRGDSRSGNNYGDLPAGIDILVTHDAPFGIFDMTGGGHWGSTHALLDAIYRAKPKVHLFGHIHEQRGHWDRS